MAFSWTKGDTDAVLSGVGAMVGLFIGQHPSVKKVPYLEPLLGVAVLGAGVYLDGRVAFPLIGMGTAMLLDYVLGMVVK